MQHDRTNGTVTTPTRGSPALLNGGPQSRRPGDRSGPPPRTATKQMSGQVGADVITALRWGVRRYAWLVVLCVLTVAVLVPAYLTSRPVEYQATALVVAQRLDMDLIALPRLGEAVFDNGEVARVVNTAFGDAGDAEDTVPQRVSLITEEDSIVFQVLGLDESPQTAAALANLAAETLTDQLNAPGEGVGLFALQTRAVLPTKPVAQLSSLSVLLPIALAAGVVLGLAAVAGLLLVRRPVLDTGGAFEVTGVPVLGSVSLPRTHEDQWPSSQEVSGIVPLCRRLLAFEVHTVVMVGPAGTVRARRQLIAAMSDVLSRARHVGGPVADSSVTDAAAAYCSDRHATWSVDARVGVPPTLLLLDGTEPLTIAQLAEGALTVLVVMSGTSTSALRAAVTTQLGIDGDMLLMLREHRVRRVSAARRGRRGAGAAPVRQEEPSTPKPPEQPGPIHRERPVERSTVDLPDRQVRQVPPMRASEQTTRTPPERAAAQPATIPPEPASEQETLKLPKQEPQQHEPPTRPRPTPFKRTTPTPSRHPTPTPSKRTDPTPDADGSARRCDDRAGGS